MRIVLTLLFVLSFKLGYSQYKLKDVPYNLNKINKLDHNGKQGLWIFFDKVDSTVYMLEHFVNNIPEGYFERYWYNGKVSEKGYHKNGSLDSIYIAYWEDGRTKRAQLEYTNGLTNGMGISYDTEERVISRLRYINGVIDSSYDAAFVDSTMISDNYIFNKVDTVAKEYKYADWNKQYAIYRNDTLVKEIDYFKGVPTIESFHENGVIVKRIVYNKNDRQKHIEKIFYYHNGELSRSEFYNKKGKLTRTVNALKR